jgi:hypothetical protein
MKKEYYLDGVKVMLTEKEVSGFNISVVKGNGYSHSYLAIEKYDPTKHKYEYNDTCQFTGRVLTYRNNRLTTKPINDYVKGTSEISFS